MKAYTIAVIGSGSTYTPEVVSGLIRYRDVLPVKSLRLMDIDDRKRTIVGGLCERILTEAGMPCEVVMTDNLDTALTGADFILTQIRVGKLPARILDETIPLRHGMIAQETTGMGGFFKALRTIPAMLEVAHKMERLCPDAFMINFTNPSGIITQAIRDHSTVKVFGLCNVPINMFTELSAKLGTKDSFAGQYLGLNHLSWMTRAVVDGVDLTARMINDGVNGYNPSNIKASGFSPECIAAAGGVPCGYLEYFYNREKKLKEQMEAEKCRGQICMEIEEELLAQYSDPMLKTVPPGLEKRGGYQYSTAAVSLINAIANDLGEEHVVNVPNAGALSFMDDDDVVELVCRVGKDGAKPLPIEHFDNRHIIGMMRTVKTYERHTVSAAVAGDEQEAMRAMLIHPLMGDWAKSHACFAEMKQAHKAWMPRFFGGEQA